MPHIASYSISFRMGPETSTSNLSPSATLIDLVDMRFSPVNQPAQAFIKINRGCETNLFPGPLWRANSIANQRGLASRSIVDGLIRASKIQKLFRDFLERRALSRADIVETIRRACIHRAKICSGTVLYRNKIEGL